MKLKFVKNLHRGFQFNVLSLYCFFLFSFLHFKYKSFTDLLLIDFLKLRILFTSINYKTYYFNIQYQILKKTAIIIKKARFSFLPVKDYIKGLSRNVDPVRIHCFKQAIRKYRQKFLNSLIFKLKKFKNFSPLIFKYHMIKRVLRLTTAIYKKICQISIFKKLKLFIRKFYIKNLILDQDRIKN